MSNIEDINDFDRDEEEDRGFGGNWSDRPEYDENGEPNE